MAQVTLSDGVLSALGRQPTLAAEFPFVRINAGSGTAPRGGCKCNRGAINQTLARSELNRVRLSILALTGPQITRFKAILGVGQLVVYIQGPKGVEKRVL